MDVGTEPISNPDLGRRWPIDRYPSFHLRAAELAEYRRRQHERRRDELLKRLAREIALEPLHAAQEGRATA